MESFHIAWEILEMISLAESHTHTHTHLATGKSSRRTRQLVNAGIDDFNACSMYR